MLETLQSTTLWEYRVWMAWMEREWERPSRSDWFLMQIALEVVRTRAKYPMSIKLKDMLLKFSTTSTQSKGTGLTPEQELALSKSVWMARVQTNPPQKPA